jgi:pimeloyl-ACP methyl ester carboxylesterase
MLTISCMDSSSSNPCCLASVCHVWNSSATHKAPHSSLLRRCSTPCSQPAARASRILSWSLGAIRVPVRVMVGTESAPFFAEVARWLADRMNVESEELPGGHTPYFDRPQQMAETLRPLLRGLSRQPV